MDTRDSRVTRTIRLRNHDHLLEMESPLSLEVHQEDVSESSNNGQYGPSPERQFRLSLKKIDYHAP